VIPFLIENISLFEIWPHLLIAISTAFVTALLLLLFQRQITSLMHHRDDGLAVQASHYGNPLRLGGIAVFSGLAAAVLLGGGQGTWVPTLVIVSAGPVFFAGLLEDMGWRVSSTRRLAAAFVSAALAMLTLGFWVTRADLPGLDQALTFAPLAVLLTLILSAGFCHATNLVDGMNGLAAIVVISASVGMWVIARDAEGAGDLAILAAVLAAAMAGFLLLNWPFGVLFLGDAGSYGVGHVLIWIGIGLAANAPEISMPALLLILFWPIADTLHSIFRRLASKSPVFMPDRMHLHQKMRRCIEIMILGGAHRRRSNPLATLALMPLIVMPVIAGVALADNVLTAWATLALFVTLFGLTHVGITRLACRGRPKPKRHIP